MDSPAGFNFSVIILLVAFGLFAAIVACTELGRRLALRRQARDGNAVPQGSAAVEAAAMALLGLLLAFTFSGAASRFDARRQLIVEEANDIGTAWLRLDLLPADSQPALRAVFRSYLDSRLATYQHLSDRAAVTRELARTAALQVEIWHKAREAATASGQTATTVLLLQALNAMFDIVTTRTMAMEMHQPPVIFELLVLMSLICAFLAGYGMVDPRGRSWIHIFGFALIVSTSVFVIFDLEHPRAGLIQVDSLDHILADLRAGMQ